MVKGKQMSVLPSGVFNYASIKDISGIELISDEFCQNSNAVRLADQQDLLLAITGATIGKIGINERYRQLAFSGDLLALKVHESIDPYYLITVLEGPIGQSQFQRWITGSTNGHLSPSDVGKIVVPRLSDDIEKRISKTTKESLNAKFESEQLLEKSKQRVEELIEEAIKHEPIR
jgi:restriction endonuclease S subunit